MRATQYRIRRFTYLQAAASIPLLFFFCLGATHTSFAQNPSRSQTSRRAANDSSVEIPQAIMLNILRAEDERRWDADLAALFSNPNAVVRSRAALAAGRIGDEGAVAPLVALLRNDADANVREMAAFALGETEAAAGADALLQLLVQPCGRNAGLRARALESLGKIAPALPEAEKERRALVGNAILAALRRELDCTLTENREVVLAGLTAILRARPADAGKTIKSLLNSSDARVRADTANALARLRSKDANAELRSRLADPDSVVRATAARALGASEDKDSFDELLARATDDADVRVRVSAVRALASLKNARAAAALQRRADSLFVSYRQSKKTRTRAVAHPAETNELLELANTLGALLANTGDERALEWLRALRGMEGTSDPEIEIAFARIAPLQYLRDPLVNSLSRSSRSSSAKLDWRVVASIAQGLGELARPSNQTSGNDSFRADALLRLRSLVDNGAAPALALPDALTALAAFKPEDLDTTLRKQLTANDFYVRATAANLLGELAPSEANTIALLAALPRALGETTNDAALAILDALAKQKSEKATSAIKTGLDSNDYLVRRRAASLLKSLGAGEYASRIGTVNTRNTVADYQLALARRGKLVRAVVLTHKGKFTIELLPDDAPLTVDNFIKLARQRFFDATTFHRVVPNFVIQGGDPRGDGNGGPPYQIRCEINRVSYARGAVGMALSGKDTGGSQWFVTHSPQPHLDGGYTVFGRVTEGMDVVDGIVRGDRILSVRIVEGRGTPARVRVNQ
ncbi:MAG: HEAT repeat domain-containing protein [Pyrinomonadaceae bacterium]|nr:HEAT repeat domain-containing protein [Pyrinomonadaceae bacterium]